MMRTGNDVLTDFTGFVLLHCDRAMNARGLQTYACTDGRSKSLHMFTLASSFKSTQYINLVQGSPSQQATKALKAHPNTPTQSNYGTTAY